MNLQEKRKTLIEDGEYIEKVVENNDLDGCELATMALVSILANKEKKEILEAFARFFHQALDDSHFNMRVVTDLSPISFAQELSDRVFAFVQKQVKDNAKQDKEETEHKKQMYNSYNSQRI